MRRVLGSGAVMFGVPSDSLHSEALPKTTDPLVWLIKRLSLGVRSIQPLVLSGGALQICFLPR